MLHLFLEKSTGMPLGGICWQGIAIHLSMACILGKLIVIKLIGKEQISYYVANAFVFLFGMVLLYFGKKIKVVDKYIFGNIG